MKESVGIAFEQCSLLETELPDNLLVPSEVALAKEVNLRSKRKDDAKTLEDGRSQAVAPQVHDEDGSISERFRETRSKLSQRRGWIERTTAKPTTNCSAIVRVR